MHLLDIIPVSSKETFLIGHLTGPVQPGPYTLRVNGVTVATVVVTGEAEVESGPKGKLQPPRVLVCNGSVDKRTIDFTRDEVTLERLE